MPLPRRLFALGLVAGLAPLAPRPAAAESAAAAPAASTAPAPGTLLVATPGMGDPRFVEAVILLVQHDAAGALGVVINRPIGPRPVADVLAAIGESSGKAAGSIDVFAGGPVQPDSAIVIHGTDYQRPSTTRLGIAEVAVTPPREVLRDIGAGRGPRRCALMLGYAGWGPSQLESELLLQAWTTMPASAALVFDMDRAKLWHALTSHRSISL